RLRGQAAARSAAGACSASQAWTGWGIIGSAASSDQTSLPPANWVVPYHAGRLLKRPPLSLGPATIWCCNNSVLLLFCCCAGTPRSESALRDHNQETARRPRQHK